jgi:hypothetical protein
MKISACSLIMVVSLGLSGVALAQEKTYQITGPVVETCCPANVVRGEPPLWIAIQKGKEPIGDQSRLERQGRVPP